MDCFSGLRFPPAVLRLGVNHEVTAGLESSVNGSCGVGDRNGCSQIEGDVNSLTAVDQGRLGYIESEEAILVRIDAAVRVGRCEVRAGSRTLQVCVGLRLWHAVERIHRERWQELLAVNRERQISAINRASVDVVRSGSEYNRIRVQELLGRELLGSGRSGCHDTTQRYAKLSNNELVVKLQQVLRYQRAGHLAALQVKLVRTQVRERGLRAEVRLRKVLVRNAEALLDKLLFRNN